MADYLFEDLTDKIIGAAFNGCRTLGSVHKESFYPKALTQELDSLKIPYKNEVALKFEYI